jgi:REP element-mobilizing transposase RayT
MSNHRAYQLYAHITWHTWKRVGCIDQAAANDLESAIRSASDDVGVHVLRRAILADHIPLVISFRPDTCLSEFVRLAKSVAERTAAFRARSVGREASTWQRCTGAISRG